MRFNLIGLFEIITDDGERLTPKAPKVCQTLAVLALHGCKVVATDVLVRELWGADPPAGAVHTLQTHIYHARRMLNDARVSASGRRLLATEAPGYRLDVCEDEVDVAAFEKLVRRAQWELVNGSPEQASRHLVTARELVHGPILSNVPHGSVLASRVAHFEELRLRALEFWVETENRLGRHRELLPELRTLVDDYPLHEWFHGELISALCRAGRRGEALEAYQNLYRILKRELGLEPSPELRQLQARILDSTVTELPRQPSRLKELRPAPYGAPPFWTSTAAG
ncbi:BTAD domain-containing putative transcriptional regulator [Streptomyces achromogenes]|uniref:AfsR/SARP family transcriptional regulator n=1 Tax=Streptomyces achromogenes TaxID=67255 RepID=A0ABZ1L0S1_STRAH|nr:AfsR/SARP family transcriptional regulator [Streptomyces sp. UMAF16]